MPLHRRVLRSPLLYLLAQLTPLGLLSVAYGPVSQRLETLHVDEVSLQQLFLISALLTPLLSQLLSGPLFRTLEGTESEGFATVAAVTVRNLPKTVLIAAVPVLVVGAALSRWFEFGPDATVALTAVLGANLVFAATLVPAYARRRGSLLVVGWAVYVVALVAIPAAWWLPASAAAAVELTILVIAARGGIPAVTPTSGRDMIAGLGQSFASAMPLWSIPIGLFVLDPWGVQPAIVFAAMTPALMVYQLFFATVAVRMWRQLDDARARMSALPAAQAGPVLDDLAFRSRSGEWRVVGLLVLVLTLGVPAMFGVLSRDLAMFVVGIGVASAAAVILIAQLCRLSMMGHRGLAHAIASAVAVEIVIAAAFGVGAVAFVWIHAAVCLVGCVAVAIGNHVTWRSPGYSMFWRTALHQ